MASTTSKNLIDVVDDYVLGHYHDLWAIQFDDFDFDARTIHALRRRGLVQASPADVGGFALTRNGRIILRALERNDASLMADSTARNHVHDLEAIRDLTPDQNAKARCGDIHHITVSGLRARGLVGAGPDRWTIWLTDAGKDVLKYIKEGQLARDLVEAERELDAEDEEKSDKAVEAAEEKSD